MRKRMTGILLLLTLVLTVTAGCSGKKEKEAESIDTKTKLTERDDPKKILKDASNLYEKETLKGSTQENTNYYSNGTEEYSKSEIVYDKEKQIIMQSTSEGGEVSYHSYNVKEDDGYYIYIKDSDMGDEWLRYKEEVEEGEPTEYESFEDGLDFDFSEEDGYQNVQYSNEGVEDLDGTETVKVKVTAEMSYSDDMGEEGAVTRESVLEENGWTEDQVALADGFSEIIDNYVKACNKTPEGEGAKYIQEVWVDVSSHKAIQIKSELEMENADEVQEDEAIRTFDDSYWMMDEILQYLDEGLTEEEAAAALKESIEYMEEEGVSDEEGLDEFDDLEETEESDVSEDDSVQTKVVSVEKILYGKDCPDIGELPEDYTETSQEGYYSGEY